MDPLIAQEYEKYLQQFKKKTPLPEAPPAFSQPQMSPEQRALINKSGTTGQGITIKSYPDEQAEITRGNLESQRLGKERYLQDLGVYNKNKSQVEDYNQRANNYREEYFGDKTRKGHNVPMGTGYDPVSDRMGMPIIEEKPLPEFNKEPKIPVLPNLAQNEVKVDEKTAVPKPPRGKDDLDKYMFTTAVVSRDSKDNNKLATTSTHYEAQKKGTGGSQGGAFARNWDTVRKASLDPANVQDTEKWNQIIKESSDIETAYNSNMTDNFGSDYNYKMADIFKSMMNWVKTKDPFKNQDIKLFQDKRDENYLTYNQKNLEAFINRYFAKDNKDAWAAMDRATKDTGKNKHPQYHAGALQAMQDYFPIYLTQFPDAKIEN